MSAPQSKFKASNERVIWGWSCLIFGAVLFFGFFFAAVISKLLPPSDNVLLSAIQNDSFGSVNMKQLKWLVLHAEVRQESLCVHLLIEKFGNEDIESL